jgi:uncharacterized membrane protein
MMVCSRCGRKFEMIHTEVSGEIKAPRERVYEVGADYANWPKHFPFIESARLVTEGNERLIETVQQIRKGKTRLVKIRQRLASPEKIEEEIQIDKRITLLIVRIYESVEDGTRLSITGYLKYRQAGALYSILMSLLKKRLQNRIHKSLQPDLDFTRITAESDPSHRFQGDI